MKLLENLWKWAEVWALLIPIVILTIRPKQPAFLRPIIVYILLALILNTLIDVSWLLRKSVPAWLHSNNYLYNIHSVVRFICFSVFFFALKQPFMIGAKRIVALLGTIFMIINFVFFENFFRYDSFSSRLFAVESAVLLFYCMQYYLFKFQEENVTRQWPPDFWVATGISIYVVFNFPYFLFYTTLIDKNNVGFAQLMWNFHNVSFLILCIFIGRGFYVSRSK